MKNRQKELEHKRFLEQVSNEKEDEINLVEQCEKQKEKIVYLLDTMYQKDK